MVYDVDSDDSDSEEEKDSDSDDNKEPIAQTLTVLDLGANHV